MKQVQSIFPGFGDVSVGPETRGSSFATVPYRGADHGAGNDGRSAIEAWVIHGDAGSVYTVDSDRLLDGILPRRSVWEVLGGEGIAPFGEQVKPDAHSTITFAPVALGCTLGFLGAAIFVAVAGVIYYFEFGEGSH